jgi:uncharacterized glyoxalase superfamily protein PhnB
MTIIAPMMAQLGVVDASRSAAFYREVLGFTQTDCHRENGRLVVGELRLGQARLQVAEHDGVADTPEQHGARHATILFFECDDVVAYHASLRSRGASPSDLSVEQFWIRMKMFEIDDPDHHTLWFGQRTDEPISGHAD